MIMIRITMDIATFINVIISMIGYHVQDNYEDNDGDGCGQWSPPCSV